LTEIGNRRYLQIKLSSALHEFHQHKLECGLLFIDTDRFKPINDNYGHKTGDVALRLISNTMRYNLRDTDAIGRWGGDEFLAILFGVEEAGLAATAHKLRILVENAQLPFGAEKIKLTVSIGATLIRLDDTPESVIERADKLMYRSKQAGGNCVTMV
jgi:diguanylate cyclase (GGDEF)-like protein